MKKYFIGLPISQMLQQLKMSKLSNVNKKIQ